MGSDNRNSKKTENYELELWKEVIEQIRGFLPKLSTVSSNSYAFIYKLIHEADLKLEGYSDAVDDLGHGRLVEIIDEEPRSKQKAITSEK